MKIKEAEAITHTLSKPGKMPGFAYSTPAHECKTGTKLRAVAGSVCANCYAYKRGRYRFQNVIDAQYKRFRSLTHPKWVEAMAAQINSKKVKYRRLQAACDLRTTIQQHPAGGSDPCEGIQPRVTPAAHHPSAHVQADVISEDRRTPSSNAPLHHLLQRLFVL